ncbi:MAG: hypothetical protein ACOCUU_03775 [Nanoarchaeota archaeon]
MAKINFKLTWKIWILIIFLILSFISIFGLPPKFLQQGVEIKSIDSNSTAIEQGFKQGQTIISINNQEINSIQEYSEKITSIYPSQQPVKTIFVLDSGKEIIYFSSQAPNILVSEISKSNIKTGLDLSGGSRALVKAKNQSLSSEEINDLVDVMSNRLNVYGITDMTIAPVSDLSGENFMLVEIAGTTPEDLENLISTQGEFKAKIGNSTVFEGGKDKGISSVSTSGQQSGIRECDQNKEGTHYCNFQFAVYLSQNAAERHAEITSKLKVNRTQQGNYLEKKLDLYVDGNLLDSLLISEGLKGQVTTQISISGSGQGETRNQAIENTEQQMKHLQTILKTGSLPYKLEIVKLDTISPTLGKEFINSILLAGISALFAISLVVFIRYRNIKSVLALLLTSVSEIIIILGISSLFNVNFDLPAIAGILATIGTGIDSQIIVLDETHSEKSLSVKQKIKRAFRIILGAYFTALVALLPLLRAGAGLLKGFAITAILGITIGVLITRPAFTDIIRKIEE